MSYLPSVHTKTFWSEIKENLSYFNPKRQKEFVLQREGLWRDHINTYTKIRHGENTDRASWGSARIDLLTLNLDILDRKFASILQFQGLLAIAMSIGMATLKGVVNFGLLLRIGIGGSVFLWFVVVFMVMRSIGRLFWGDMWKERDLVEAESNHVNTLINCVVRRTARFRISVLLSLVNGLMLVLLLLSVLIEI